MGAKIITGIDIGLDGGICFLNTISNNIMYTSMPVIENDGYRELDFANLFSHCKPKNPEDFHIVFEDLHSLHQASTSATWSLAHQAGAIEMMCVALGISYTKVAPKEWQKKMFLNIPPVRLKNGRTDTKAMALIAAKKLYPNETFLATPRSRVAHNGIVDAVNLAKWAQLSNK